MNRLYTDKWGKLKLVDEMFYPLVETMPTKIEKGKNRKSKETNNGYGIKSVVLNFS